MIGSDIAVRPAMSARQFLATPQGAALRARAGTRFLGQIGTVMDLIDLVKSIAAGAPGMSVEDILNNHQSLLEEILRRQAEMSQEIGGINDSLDGSAAMSIRSGTWSARSPRAAKRPGRC